MSVGDLLETARLIIQSNPDRLNDFAERWARVAGAAQGQELVVKRAIMDVEGASDGATAQQMVRYRIQTGDGMVALSAGAAEVAEALRQVAPRIATIRKDLMAALVGAAMTGAALFVPVVGPVVGRVVQGLAGGAEVVTIVNLVNNYGVEMTALRQSMTTAQAKMALVETLTAAGGVLPQAPSLAPG